MNISKVSVHFKGDRVHPSPVDYILVGVENTSSFPADRVLFSLIAWESNSKEKHVFALKRAETSVYFPHVCDPNLTFVEASEDDPLILNPNQSMQMEIEISYYNELTDKTHRTRRSYIADYDPAAHADPIPIPEFDYWD